MAARLPLRPSIGQYEFTTVLGGLPFLIGVRWNARAAKWIMDIYTVTREPIRVGIAIVLGAWLGRRCVDERFPPGIMIASDTTGEDVDATFDDLGTRVVVDFYTFDEYEEAFGG